MYSSNGAVQGTLEVDSFAPRTTTTSLSSLLCATSDFSITSSKFSKDAICAPCHESFEELRALKDGWDGEGSLAIRTDALASATTLLVLVPELQDLVCVYPTFEGGVLLEYMMRDWSYSLEIASTGSVGFCGVQVSGQDEFDLIDHSVEDKELLTKIRNTTS
jgi:hypothetical protein